MFESYRRVFAHPGTAAFSATGLVARLPISMMTLGIVLLVSTLSGSYALAGQVSAAYIVGNAVFAVPHGRLADRFGQRKVLWVDSLVFAVFTGLLVHSITHDWSDPLPHLFAAVSGMSIPQIGAMVRSRWANLLDDDEERHTAFAVESVADEMVFVAGPALVTFLSTAYAPQSGLLVALVAGTIGTVALALQRRTEPPAHPRQDQGAKAHMPWRALVPITISAIALGSLFGALEVATVAFAEDEGRKAFAGVMLAVFSAGSLLAGVAAGTMKWSRGPLERAKIGMWLLAAGTLLLPLMPHLVPLGLVLFLTGLALAPTLIAVFSVLEAITPRARLNEAMGFVQTGLSAGIAPGAWLAGVVADGPGGSTAFWVCVVSALLAASGALLTPASSHHSVSPSR